jgi:predicted anti-sigma-YlaC factor YlaD
MSQRIRFMLNCQDTAQLLSDSMDRRLGLYTGLRIYMHLRICRLCQAYNRHLHLLRDLVRQDPAQLIDSSESATSGLSAEAKRRIIRTINAVLQSRPHP